MHLNTDSRKIKPGDTFVAIKGCNVDGHDFIAEAIDRGAKKLVVEKLIDANIEVEVVNDTKEYLANYLQQKYQKELKQLKIIGITGTNGKTTTAFFVYQLLKKLKQKVAYIGTIGFYIEHKVRNLLNTTPDIMTLYQLFIEAYQQGCKIIVMEVSSHGLKQERIKGITLDVGAFTNLSQDHLDYHKTMTEYVLIKSKILDYIKPDGIMVINQDDEYFPYFQYDPSILFGFHGKDFKIRSYHTYHGYTKILFEKDKLYEVTIPCIGVFNVYNYMLALIIVHCLKYSIEEILLVSNQIVLPPGRSKVILYKQGSIMIDFAHTPDAIENILKTCKTGNRIITVIGCGGNRDAKKRPMIGEIASRYSDHVIFTMDNPRFEDPKQIINDMIKGVKKDNYEIIYDRKKAIYQALDMLKDQEMILILGKGHETSIQIKDNKIPFQDEQVVTEYIEKHSL